MAQSLTPEEVSEIKKRIWDGLTQLMVAREFGVSQGTISKIMNGHQWGEVVWPNGDVGQFPVSRRLELHAIAYGMPDKKMELSMSATAPERPVVISAIAEQAAALIEEEEDARYLAEQQALAESSPRPRQEKKQKEVKIIFDRDTWNTFLTVAPDNKYIKNAEESGSDLERMAVIQTFSALPDSMWDSKMIPTYIKAAKEELERQLVKKPA